MTAPRLMLVSPVLGAASNIAPSFTEAIGAAEFLPIEEALARLPHRLARRIQAAHAALLAGVPAVLIDGKSHVLSSSAVSEAR